MNPTINDVAKEAQVSAMTVSRVINQSEKVSDEARERVLKAIKKLGYEPHAGAQALARKKSRTIGIAVPYRSHIFSVDFFLRLIDGIETTADEQNYEVLIYNSARAFYQKGLNYKRFYRAGIIDGLIIIAPHVNEIPAVRDLAKDGLPYVIASGRWPGLNFVDGDNTAGAYQAVKHLIDLGHKKIAFLAGDSNTSNGLDRMEGYRKALKNFGIPYDEELIEVGNFDLKIGHEAMKKLLSRKKFSAVFCANDFMAVVAILAAKEAGLRVPEDLSVVGYDDNEWAQVQKPPLTSVRQPLIDIGRISVSHLLNQIGSKQKTLAEILPNELIMRSSSAKVS